MVIFPYWSSHIMGKLLYKNREQSLHLLALMMLPSQVIKRLPETFPTPASSENTKHSAIQPRVTNILFYRNDITLGKLPRKASEVTFDRLQEKLPQKTGFGLKKKKKGSRLQKPGHQNIILNHTHFKLSKKKFKAGRA